MQVRSVFQAMSRGARRRCPACGQGRLFAGYLKVDPFCAACGHQNGLYRADDAPPYFTILLVGHLVVAPMLAFPFIWKWPALQVLALTLPTLVIATLVLLPLVKGAVVGAMYILALNREVEPEAP